MFKTIDSGAYAAPLCEIAGECLEELLCQSPGANPGGTTEPYGDDVPFNW